MSNRRDFLKSAAAVAGLPVVLPRVLSERAPAADRPNILFFFPDQLRYDWTGANPSIPVRTPVLDRVMARGVRFDRAYVASPLCAPSRACLALGKEYDNCPVFSNGQDLSVNDVNFYRLLQESGYHTMGCGKFDLHKSTEFWELDGSRLLAEWGFSDGIDNAGKWDAIRSGSVEPKDPYMGYLRDHGWLATHVNDMESRRGFPKTFTAIHATDLPERAYCDNWIGHNGLDLIRRAPKDKPWFLQVNFAGPHEPNDVTHRMKREIDARNAFFPQPNNSTQLDPVTHNQVRQNYSSITENIDRLFGLYIDILESTGQLENTIIVFSSDHGEMLGDHDRWTKRYPYEASVGVPLVIAGPGVRQGYETNALASVMDVAATCLDFAGVSVPSEMDSRSMKPILTGDSLSHRDYLFSGFGSWRSGERTDDRHD